MGVYTFRDIIAWQKAHELALCVYKVTEKFPKNELFGLISQMRRCAISVPSNIAEGFKRGRKKDSLNFYTIAEGSLEELKYQSLLSKDLKYLTEQEFDVLYKLSEEVGKLIYGWKKKQI